jgi:CIC family chloride channel protein
MAVPVVVFVGKQVGREGMGLGLLGGGYGAAQIAITGSPWFPTGWRGVELLALLGAAKIVATSLTVGSGGSAGDFGPSLVIGGIFGGAFGRAAQLLLHDPRIDPGAFALVGMGTFDGGLAHVPIAALVMVCELAGSYDLLVPLMLATGISFIALRHRTLYHAQRMSWRDSPAHHDELVRDVLRDMRVGACVVRDRPYAWFQRSTRAEEVIRRIADGGWQDVFPVLSDDQKVVGVITTDVLRMAAQDPEIMRITIADDLMIPPCVVGEGEDVGAALDVLLLRGARELVVVDDEQRVVGFLDEAEITRLYRRATQATEAEPEKAEGA